MKLETVILGIDPGNAATGYAVLQCGARSAERGISNSELRTSHSSERLLACGAVRPAPKGNAALRLHKIYEDLSALIEMHEPSELAIESIFHAQNARAALALGQARGAALAAAGAHGLEVFEYSPLLVKQTVTGYGRAEKEQVKKLVLARLPGAQAFEAKRLPIDAWDAAAIALCHACHRNSHR